MSVRPGFRVTSAGSYTDGWRSINFSCMGWDGTRWESSDEVENFCFFLLHVKTLRRPDNHCMFLR